MPQRLLPKLLCCFFLWVGCAALPLAQQARGQVDADSSGRPPAASPPPRVDARDEDGDGPANGIEEEVTFERLRESPERRASSEEEERADVGAFALRARSDRTATRPVEQRAAARGPRIDLDQGALPEAARREVTSLNVKNADLRDVLRGLGEQYGVNLIVDDDVRERVTTRLTGLSVIDALVFLTREYGLSLLQRGSIFRVKRPPEPEPAPEPPPEPPAVSVSGGRLTVDLSGDSLGSTLRALSRASGKNIVASEGASGPVSGYLDDAPFESGLATLLSSNGFRLRERDDIYVVTEARSGRGGEGGREDGGSLWTEVSDGSIDVDVTEASVGDVLRDIAEQVDVNIVTYGVPEGRITAQVEGLTVEQALNMLLKGTDLSYRKENDIYFIGGKDTSGITSSKLISLDHIKAESVLKKIPGRLKQSATVQAVPEHNGLLVTGTSGAISEMEQFVGEIDYPTPLILIEALVVDFQTTDLFELGFEFGRDGERAGAVADESYKFDQDGYEIEGDGRRVNDYMENFMPFLGQLGIQKIGELPEDFYFKLRALSEEGKADIRSRPQIATLNGHKANLSIGTTQYYILESEAPGYYGDRRREEGDGNRDGRYYRSRERFEKIEASVKLDITPWVSASGEVTTEIRPEFSTPVGNFQPGVPPTINSRVLESTVRLKDGETIVLGGLIQEDRSVSYSKVPILGSIPLLGQLFRTRTHDTKKSELVIYLTPHVFYGDGRDQEKWGALREQLDLHDPGATPSRGATGFTQLEEAELDLDREAPEERRRAQDASEENASASSDSEQ